MLDSRLCFGEFHFDPASQCIWRGGDELVALTPKSLRVLLCLLERAGELVSKDALLGMVWPDTTVTDASLKVCVREIRRALGDPAATPRFIGTMHGRGYRFIAPVTRGAVAPHWSPARAEPSAAESPAAAAMRTTAGACFVGRSAPVAALRGALTRAAAGERQIVFVTGEAGIGKTTLIESFLERVAAGGDALVMRGRCLEHFGASEAYLPMLEALRRLCRAAPHAVPLLRARAPTWAAQLPGVIAPNAPKAAPAAGAAPRRMLCEIADAFESLAAEAVLILVLEDLHWGDPSTLDAIALLAQRAEPARLFLLASYRPIEAILAAHPVRALKQRLMTEQRCGELALDPLSPAELQAYLTARLGGAPPPALAEVVHQRTEGNPLFMVNVIDELLSSRRLVRAGVGWHLAGGVEAVATNVPESVRLMVEQQADQLAAEDLALLEAAALARAEFPVAMVAAALAADPLATERRCEELARRTCWLSAVGIADAADGALSGCYRFAHELYRSVLAQRVPVVRRARLHLRLGEWLEEHTDDRSAGELAMHFEHGRDAVRAVRYLRAAAYTAAARSAQREAIDHLDRALGAVERLPAVGRGATRRGLLEQRGLAHRARGDVDAAVADLEAWAASARADEDAPQEVRALLALSAAWSLRDRAQALAFAEQAVERSQRLGVDEVSAMARGVVAYWHARIHGWRDADAAAATAAMAVARRGGRAAVMAPHLGIYASFANLRGDYTAAAHAAGEGVEHAVRAGDSFALALCRFQQVWALQHAGAWGALLHALRDGLQAAERNQHLQWALVFRLLAAGWQATVGLHREATAAGASGLVEARAAGHEYGVASAILVCGWAALERGAAAAADAEAHFTELAAAAARRPAAMEWILRLPLEVGLSAAALAAGNAVRADAAARRACALAGESGEPTYLALAHRARAAAALAERRWEDAAAALAAARAVVDGANAPLAAWQVWATAAALAAARGRAAEAREHRDRAGAVLERLAVSLNDAAEPAIALGFSIDAAQQAIRSRLRGLSLAQRA